MTRARRTLGRPLGIAALLAALLLPLGACSPPSLPGLGGTDLAENDVITLTHPSAGMFGYYGDAFTTVEANAVTTSYVLPDGTEIFSLTDEIDSRERERIEDSAERYLAWEKDRSDDDRTVCTDIPSTTVEVSGSITHESVVLDCGDAHPLQDLEGAVGDARSSLAGRLARPAADWSVEIRSWAGGGPNESAPVERYRLLAAEHETGMGATAQHAPEGWGADLPEDTGDGAPLGWDTTGTVLLELNAFLIGQDQLGCEDPTGEIRVIREGTPSLTWTSRLCAGQQSEVLAEVLRGL